METTGSSSSLSHTDLVLEFIWSIKWLVSMRNATLGWNGLTRLTKSVFSFVSIFSIFYQTWRKTTGSIEIKRKLAWTGLILMSRKPVALLIQWMRLWETLYQLLNLQDLSKVYSYLCNKKRSTYILLYKTRPKNIRKVRKTSTYFCLVLTPS